MGVVIDPNNKPNFIHNLLGITKNWGTKKISTSKINEINNGAIKNLFKKKK